jgi:CubicO group peptidase (beta-lactamase class C family)
MDITLRIRRVRGIAGVAAVLGFLGSGTPPVWGEGPMRADPERIFSQPAAALFDGGGIVLRPSARTAPWPPFRVSSPEAQGMDAAGLAMAYERAAAIPHIYSMLVIRHGALVAEEYFGTPQRASAMPVASVAKSIVGALVGIALEEGYLVDLDERMIDYFPEFDGPGLDPRKRDITVRQLVQMRAGFPFDSTNEFFDGLVENGNWMRFIITEWPLVRDPGSGHDYSSASAHLLSGIVTKASGMSLRDLANRYLFGRMGQPIETWPRDPQGYCIGSGDVHCTPLQLASLGQMMLDGGRWRGRWIVSPQWVADSLHPVSASPYGSSIRPYQDMHYGQLWWQATIAGREVFFAWGHGGQFVTLVPTLDLIVVTTAYNFVGDFTDNSWNTEGAIMRLIGTDVIPAAD